MEHIQKLSYTELDTIGTSTLITRMTSDVNQVQTGTNLVLRLFMRSPFIVFGSIFHRRLYFENLLDTISTCNCLCDIDLHVKTGQTIGIIGGTGSGKTSVVNLIPRFFDATQGNVLVFGKPVKEQDMESLRSQIAIVPQKAVLFAGTIRENMKWGKEDAYVNDT